MPLVLLDGVALPGLVVREVEIAGPLDRRRVTVEAPPAPEQAPLFREAAGRAEVALPLRLSDGRVRWVVLASGRLVREQARAAAGEDRLAMTLEDAWSERLGRPIEASWESADGQLIRAAPPRGALSIGTRANRSAQRFDIAGRLVFVPQRRTQGNGGAWTVGAALDTLAAFAAIDLGTAAVPEATRAAPLLEEIDLARPLGLTLETILEPYGLAVRRELARDGGATRERLAVVPGGAGSTVDVPWTSAGRPPGEALRVERDRPLERAEPWVARAAGWRVESTFALIGGWDAALEGEPDATYSREANPGFAAYADVYRLWALNEDGRFTPPPFGRGPAFDAAAFFGEGEPAAPRPLRFLPCLTLDGAGRERDAIVEVSTDGGAAWARYAGDARPREDLAAVYLNDATLPAVFLAAAQAGTARVRVTASLQSPRPVRAVRWRGNPFAGSGPARVFDLGDAVLFRRVDGQSIHHAGVQGGQLAALQADGTGELRAWLNERVRRAGEGAGLVEAGRATLELAGTWPALRPGDRVIDASGTGASGAARRGVVRRVRMRWPAASLDGDGASRGREPVTVVELEI